MEESVKRGLLLNVTFPNYSKQLEAMYRNISIQAIYLSFYFGIKFYVNIALIPLNAVLNTA